MTWTGKERAALQSAYAKMTPAYNLWAYSQGPDLRDAPNAAGIIALKNHYPHLEAALAETLDALAAVIREADRETDAFIRARDLLDRLRLPEETP